MLQRSLTYASSTLILALLFAVGSPAQAEEYETIEGHLDIVWGDPPAGSGLPSPTVLTVTEDSGQRTEIAISEELAAAHGGFLSWNRQRVRVHLAEGPQRESPGGRPDTRRALALTLMESRDEASARGGVTGSQPWVSILCKFADVDAEPEDLAFFEGMYANEVGGLDDYWRKQSYDNIDIVGSVAVDWVDLPGRQTDYVSEPGSGTDADLDRLFDDCTAAADPFVDFSNNDQGGFSGINQMFNANLDCCAWGGGRFATLDGVFKGWRVTWEPPWGYAQSAVIAHEMGHGFGLPHSNNSDQDADPYDSPWDVMSAATSYATSDSTYGALGKHHTAYHKNSLGWIEASEIFEAPTGESATITIDAMAVASTSNYRMARIPIPNTNDWYTVEARKRLGYDGALPGKAVIISRVDTGRGEPAWSVDIDEPPANFADNAGSMFLPGETFYDPDADIGVAVDSETADGYVVTIYAQSSIPIFDDRFEGAAAGLR